MSRLAKFHCRSNLPIFLGTALISAQFSSAGTLKTITLDGDFSDWTDVPVVATDPQDASDGNTETAEIDYASVQIANDGDYLYVRYTFHEPVNSNFTGGGTYLAIDSDVNAGTGFDIFGLGLAGSEAGWQNEFPFAQATGVFNSGSLSDAAMNSSPWNVVMSSQEIRIDLDAVVTASNAPVFPDTFRLLFYHTNGSGDVIGPVTYSLAPVPEPSMLAVGVLGLGLMRRRRA